MEKQSILRYLNEQIRASRPKMSVDKVCQVFNENNLLEIGFLSQCCRNDASGSCIMCDYGCASGTRSDDEYISEMINILEHIDTQIDTLLLCTNGSFFDEYQISSSLFNAIIATAAKYDISIIEFETHYSDVTTTKLDIIKSMLPDKQIMIEMGLESINPKYQKDFIMKNINLESYERTIRLIQSYGFIVETNIMLGLPFLSPQEQLEDAQKTIYWALSHECKIVLFPINIKPYTLLMQMYMEELYYPISHWLLIILLDRIPEKDLDKITVAWYGNREEKYVDSVIDTVFPTSCPICMNTINTFYCNFLKESSSKSRKGLIRELIHNTSCNCLHKQIDNLNLKCNQTYEETYKNFCNILHNKYIN